MKIIIEDPGPEEEDEIIIRCRAVDESVLKLINAFKIGTRKMNVTKGERISIIDVKDIFYFEAVDNKVFVYLKQEVYETGRRLYELEQDFEGTDFFRASKSTIINLTKVKSLTPAFSGRFEALLLNGEKVIVSRQYMGELKKKLGL